jgi:YD repeat-containing protein
MVCRNCRTILVDWQTSCPACGVPTQRSELGSRARRLFRRARRPALLLAAALIVLVSAYGVVAKRVPLSVWTIPLMLEVGDRIRDHPGAVAALGDDIRVGWIVTGATQADETGWREFRISAPVSGPKNKGTLSIRAGRGARGRWSYTTLGVDTATGQRIDLLQAAPADIAAPPSGRRLYLVPFGRVERVSLEELARHYRTRLGLQVDLSPVVSVPASVWDHARRQLVAESAIDIVRWRVGEAAANQSATFIAVTDYDMYMRNVNWRFAFSYRGDERFALVSTARMAPMAYEYRGKEYLLNSRVRKMVGKNIGVLLYRFPLSADPTSLLRDNIRSVADLDRMRDTFEGLGARVTASEMPVSHRLPPAEPRITTPPPAPRPGAGYPCFVVRAGAASAAAMSTCNIGMRTEREYDELEVDLRSGMLITRKTDLFVSDVVPLALTRCYRLWDQHARAFGIGTNHPFDSFPVGSRQPYTYVDVITADGSTIHYDRISQGTGYADAVYEHAETGTPFFRSRVQWNGKGWDLRLADGGVLVFPESYAAKRSVEAALIGMRDGAQRAVTFDRDARRNLRKLTTPSGRFIKFEYDAADRIRVAADDQGRAVRYDYDPGGRLVTVTDHAGRTLRYHYDRSDMVAMDAGEARSAVQVRYRGGRVAELHLPKQRVYRFKFDFVTSGAPHATTAFVTEPDGGTTEIDIRSGASRRAVRKPVAAR